MCKQYFIVIFICAVLHENVVLSTNSKTYARNGTVNNSMEAQAVVAGADNNSTNNATSTIITEGGHVKMNPILAAVHHGRENVEIDSPIVTQKPDNSKVNTNATTNSTKLHSTIPGSVSTTTVLPTSLTTASITKPTTLLSDTSLPLEVHGDSKIKPRKGVNMNLTQEESNSTIITKSTFQLSTTPVVTNATVAVTNTTIVTTNTSAVTVNRTTITSSTTPSTTTVKPKKPTVTIGSDDEPPLVRAPPKVITGNKVLQPKNVTGPVPILVANGGEQVIGNRQLKKGPDYVLPIVLTILAVPLLAVILTVVYKRGAEWWQHRHYRRMDFLIDGMYNN